MRGLSIVKATLKHPGTGRLAAVVRVRDVWSSGPISFGSERYVLVVASAREAQMSSVEVARAWVEAGACYVCAWGPGASEVEETFDYAAFLPELGEPLPFTLMTTSHESEAFEEALWFAFYNGRAPDDSEDGAGPVVVVVDSEDLEARAIAWVQGNTK